MKTILATSLSLIGMLCNGLYAQTVTVKNSHGTKSIDVEVTGSNTIIEREHNIENIGPSITKRLTVRPGQTGNLELKVITRIAFPQVKGARFSMMYTYGPKAYSGAEGRKHKYTFTENETIERGLG